jgi:phenylalanine-4-hydroxylase
VVSQRWEDYGEDAHRAWRQVLARNEWMLDAWEPRIHRDYVSGIRSLELPDHVPRVEEINERLAPTGWSAVCVDGYVPSAAYVALIADRIFPMSRRIRHLHHVDYSPEPDLAHDVIGHLPLLFSPEHRDFIRRLAHVMGRAKSNGLDDALYAANRHLAALKVRGAGSMPELRAGAERVARIHRALRDGASELAELARMYLWGVEFALMGDVEKPTIAGAALFSATLELESIVEGRARLVPYSIDCVQSDIDFTDLQSSYFVARDFAHLHDVLDEYELRMAPSPASKRGRG